MRKIYIQITLILVFLITSELTAQLKKDPGELMYKFYFKNSFGRITSSKQVLPSAAYVPIYINNFSDYDLKDSTTSNNFSSYCVFPRTIKSNESQTGMLFFAFTKANKAQIGQISILYKFQNSYGTPFVFRVLTQNPTPPPESRHNGIGNLLKGIGSFFSIFSKVMPTGVGSIISFLLNTAAYFVMLPPYELDSEWASFYSLAYVYAAGGNVNIPEIIYYADTTGTPSVNASYMYWNHEPTDTSFVIENSVVYFNQMKDFPAGNTPGYTGPAHVINIYNRWEFNASHIKASAEWIRDNKKEYQNHPDLKKFIDDILSSSVNEIAEIYTGEKNCFDSSETLKFLNDYFTNKLKANSSDFETKLKKIKKIHGME